jgi:hypothetical protein
MQKHFLNLMAFRNGDEAVVLQICAVSRFAASMHARLKYTSADYKDTTIGCMLQLV